MPSPLVSITTVLFNSSATVERFAQPLKEPVSAGLIEVIAVDNASPDDSSERLKAALPEAQIVRAPRNLGFAGGCNLAWPSVRGRFWLLLNPDVEASDRGIRDLVAWMGAHPKAALVSPMLDDGSGRPVSVARAFPSVRWTLGEMLRLHKLIGARRRSARLQGSYWDGSPAAVDWVPFAAAMIRREAVDELGPLSEELFMYGEDIEWCWRARRAGWLVTVCSDATFVHIGGTSAAATWNETEIDERLVAGTADALRLMHGSAWTRLYSAAAALHLYEESLNPRREDEQRLANRRGARSWFREAMGGVRPEPQPFEQSASSR